MYQGGFVAANDGNISCKVGDNGIWATPTGVSKGFMTEDMLVKLDLDGNVLEGTHKPSSEIKMPQSIQREPEGTGRGPCTSPDSNGVCLRAHQPGRTGADGRSSVAGLCAVRHFCLPAQRSAGSGVLLLSGIQCSTVLANHGTLTRKTISCRLITAWRPRVLCEIPDDEQLHPRGRALLSRDESTILSRSTRDEARTTGSRPIGPGRAESGGYLCFQRDSMA